METGPCIFPLPSLNCCAVLYGTLALALLALLTKMSLPGSFVVWNGIVGRVWKCVIRSSPGGNLGHPPPGQPEYYEANERRSQGFVDKEEGTAVQGRDSQHGQPVGRATSSISIRRLLCDNAACALCERTAMEAAEVVRIQRMDPGIPPLPQPPLPDTSYVERASLPAFSALRDSAPFPPVSTREPVASGSTWQAPLRREGHKGKLSHPPPSTPAPAFRVRDRSGHQSQSAHKEEENSESSEDEEGHFLVSSSGTSMLAVPSGGESSPCSYRTRTSHYNWKDQAHLRHRKTSLRWQNLKRGSYPSDRDSSSESDHRSLWDKNTLKKQGEHILRLSREASAVTSPGILESQRFTFAAVGTPFVTEATRESLEWHMIGKRVQHSLGLPWLLLKSLRAFQPLAPTSGFRRLPKREVVVVIRLQGLAFLSVQVRRQLEHHVRRMVHLKRWGLPRRVQRALEPLRLASRTPAGKKGPAVRNEGQTRQKGQRAGKLCAHVPPIASAAPGDETPKPPRSFQAKLQIHIGKKSLEIGQEAFPKRVQDSRKLTAPEEREPPLPKLIPTYRSRARRCNGPSLGLRGKADRVDMNTKCKYIQFLWGLPTRPTHPLYEVGSRSLELPVAPPQVHPIIEFREAETPFLPHSVWQYLEMHVIRKRMQHQWGQPRLMQQSLEMFLTAAPPAAAPHSVPTRCLQVEIKVLPKGSLPFISLEVKRHLDNHIKSKIIERRWGIPKRVMDSFHKLMPFSLSLTRQPRDSWKTSFQGKEVLKELPSRETPNLFEKGQVEHGKYSSLRRHVARKGLEIQMELVDSVMHVPHATSNQMQKQHSLPKIIPIGLKAQQPRYQELAFVEATVLVRVEFNIIHKNVAAWLGLSTLYKESLSRLFKDVTLQPRCPPMPGKGPAVDFTATETPFLDQGTRAELEWHVRRKRMQHTWGVPILVQKSLDCLFPRVPRIQTARHVEVTVLPAQLSFLSQATVHELERNVAKRAMHQQWHLPRRVLGSLRLFSPEMMRAGTPEYGPRKPRAIERSSVCQPQVLLKLQPEVLEKTMLHISKKHMEVSLGAPPAMARFSWQSATISSKQPLPKLIPPGCRTPQKRRRFLPFGHPEDLDKMELSLRRNRLQSQWGLGAQYTEAVRRLMPRASGVPRRVTVFPLSSVNLPFLQEQEREALELHVRRKRLEHTWGVLALVQNSLWAFFGETPSPLAHWKTPVVQIHIQCPELSFLSQDTHNSLEFHIQGIKQRHQWGLPRRVVESLRAMTPASVAGWQQSPLLLPPSTQRDGDWTKPDLQERGAGLDFSEAQVPFLANKDREGLELHLKKKRMQHEWSLPGVVKRSLEGFIHGAPSLHHLQKATLHIQTQPEELPFLPMGVCTFLEQHIQGMKHRQQWHLPKRILQSLRPLGWQLGAENPEEKRRRAPHRSPKRSPEERSGQLTGRRTTASPSPEAHPLHQFLEEQTPFLQEQLRDSFEQHVRMKRLEHVWGLPGLVRKSLHGFIQSAPPEPHLRKTDIHVRILHGHSFLPQSICSHLELHLQRMQVQRQWRLPGRVLESTRMFLRPEFRTHPSHKTRTKHGHWAASELLPVGGGHPDQHDNLLSMLGPQFVPKLQLHLAMKSTEVQLEAIPDVVSHSWAPMTLSSRWSLPKMVHPQDKEALSGIRESKPFSEQTGPRRVRTEFAEAQTPFLHERKREALEAHITKKKIHHTWGFPSLVQKSLKAFLQETPRLPLPKENRIHVRVLRQGPSFLPQKISSRLEFHIQKRKVQRQWGLPKQVLASLKIFFPVDFLRKSPLSYGKDLGGGSFEWGKTERGQKWKVAVDAFSSEQKGAMKKHFEKKRFQVHQEMEPKLVRKSQEEASSLQKKLGQKWLPKRAETSGFPPPSPMNDSLLNVPYKQQTSAWGLTRKSLEPQSKIASGTHTVIPTGQWSPNLQEVKTLHLQSEQKEALEYHIKKKRLQHEWGLPRVVKRSLQALAPPLPGPICPSLGRAQKVQIQTGEASFLPLPFRKALEGSLKRMIIRRQWGLPKRIRDSIRVFSPAVGQALEVGKEGHGNLLVEEDIFLSGEDQQATEEGKEPTMKTSVSGSHSPQTRGDEVITREKPETLKQSNFSTERMEMEGLAMTGKTPSTTKEEEEEGKASMAELQAMENVACELSQATEEEASLGREVASKTPLIAEEVSSVTQISPRTSATFAVPDQSLLSVQDTAEEAPTSGESFPATEGENVLDSPQEENIPSPQNSQTREGKSSRGPHTSQPTKEENTPGRHTFQVSEEENSRGSRTHQPADQDKIPRSHCSLATGEESILKPQLSQSVEEEICPRPQSPQLTEDEGSPELQGAQSTEEENRSRLHSSPTTEEESTLGSQSSQFMKEENSSGLQSLQAMESEDGCSPEATGERNLQDEGTVAAGTGHDSSGCLPQSGKAMVKDRNLLAQQESMVTAELPANVNTLEGGIQGGGGTPQSTERTGMVMAEIPWAAEQRHSPDHQKPQHAVADPLRSQVFATSRGSPQKDTPELLGAPFPPARSRGDPGSKPWQGEQLQAPPQARSGPASGLQKKPPTYQNELKLWLGPGGKIASEKPPFCAARGPLPSTDLSGGGSWETDPQRSLAGSPLARGKALIEEATQRSAAHSCLQRVAHAEGSEPLLESLEETDVQQPPLIRSRYSWGADIPRQSQTIESLGQSSAERGPRAATTGSPETLLWGKGKIFRQLESSLQEMALKRHCPVVFPSVSRQSHGPHPVGWKEPSSAGGSRPISPPCWCHAAGYQQGSAFPSDRDECQEGSPVPSAEDVADPLLPSPGGSRETLPRPSEIAVSHLLQEAHVTVVKSTSRPLLGDLGEECRVSVEDEDQFVTECEWERIGDWDSDDVQPHSTASSALEEEDVRHVWEGPTGGCCPKTMALLGSQGEYAPTSAGQDAGNLVCHIGTVLERKLSLNQGMHLWVQSESRKRVASCEKSREDASTVDSRAEEMQGRKPLGAALPPGAEPAVKGGVPERRSEVPEKKFPNDGRQSEASGTKSGTEGLRRQEAHRLERPTERRPGSQKGALESLKPRPSPCRVDTGRKEGSISSIQVERLNRETWGFGREQWSPTGSQATPQSRVWRSERRETTSTVRVQSKDRRSSLAKERNGKHKDVNGLANKQAETTVWATQKISTFFKSFLFKLLHRQDHQATARDGHGGQDVQHAARGKDPRGHHHSPASTSPLGGPYVVDQKSPNGGRQSKVSGMTSGAEGVRRQDACPPERPAERRPGSQKGAPDSRKRRPSTSCRETGRTESNQTEGQAFRREQRGSTDAQATPQTRAWRSQRKEEESTVRVRNVAVKEPGGQEPHHEVRGQDLLPRGHHHGSASSTSLMGMYMPRLSENELHSLRGRIRSRHRKLSTPSDSVEEMPP